MFKTNRVGRKSFLTSVAFIASISAFGQANGKLQIHFMNVGQGDGAVLISPLGEIVLFDDGVVGNCDKPAAYLRKLGVTKIDYHIASHYHQDHIGCCGQILGEFLLQKDALDHGGSYSGTVYDSYIATIGAKRKTAVPGTTVTLDSGSANPVRIDLVAINGNGVATDNENDKSLAAVVRFGKFDAEISGDLSGYDTPNYKDIETSVAPKVGKIEVYKVHHHGSSHSSNPTWLSTTTPKVGIVSCGPNNTYGHPTEEAMNALHAAGVKCYWTSSGKGVPPEPGMDIVGGNIVVEVAANAETFTVRHNDNHTDTYTVWDVAGVLAGPTDTGQTYWWSTRSASHVYHYGQCSMVNYNSPNWEHGNAGPTDWRLHSGCPR
jgi:beta-lactamase superfamily II metal-dependent hydrolase